MKQEHIDRIVSCYGDAGEFKINEKYSRPHETVYTRDGDKYHWLAAEQKSSGSVAVRKTDEHGKITAWDTYESFSDVVQWTCAESLRAEGRGTVRFGMDEIKTICQAVSSGSGCQFPQSIECRLSALSAEIREGFLAAAAAHGMPEQRPSVRKRMAEIKERRKNQEPGREKMQKKAERDAAVII